MNRRTDRSAKPGRHGEQDGVCLVACMAQRIIDRSTIFACEIRAGGPKHDCADYYSIRSPMIGMAAPCICVMDAVAVAVATGRSTVAMHDTAYARPAKRAKELAVESHRPAVASLAFTSCRVPGRGSAARPPPRTKVKRTCSTFRPAAASGRSTTYSSLSGPSTLPIGEPRTIEMDGSWIRAPASRPSLATARSHKRWARTARDGSVRIRRRLAACVPATSVARECILVEQRVCRACQRA